MVAAAAYDLARAVGSAVPAVPRSLPAPVAAEASGRAPARSPRLEGSHALDHHERIALAQEPHLIGESNRRRRVDVPACQRADQGRRVGSRQRTKGELPERGSSIRLLGAAGAGRSTHPALPYALIPTIKSGHASIRRTRKVKSRRLVSSAHCRVLEDEEQRPGSRRDLAGSATPPRRPVWGFRHRGAARLTELWQELGELTLPDRIRPRRESPRRRAQVRLAGHRPTGAKGKVRSVSYACPVSARPPRRCISRTSSSASRVFTDAGLAQDYRGPAASAPRLRRALHATARAPLSVDQRQMTC